MDLNHETAMRLWGKYFGKATTAKDFAGRKIVKGAYNDRNSDYGWNVDHILPQSKGGTTADHNLVCCHIKTNDEKADSFPCFVANEVRFEIIKVQNHYEIRKAAANDESDDHESEEEDYIDFYDSAAGIRLFKQLKGIQNKPRFVGSVLIYIENLYNTAVADFIEKIFDEEEVSYQTNADTEEMFIVVQRFDMPFKETIQELLDKCILLNTYLGYYFLPQQYIGGYDIYFRVDHFTDKYDMYDQLYALPFKDARKEITNSLYINELVIINTEAKDKVQSDDSYTKYGYIFTNLANNLKKGG